LFVAASAVANSGLRTVFYRVGDFSCDVKCVKTIAATSEHP
jgi:hypothetical protein